MWSSTGVLCHGRLQRTQVASSILMHIARTRACTHTHLIKITDVTTCMNMNRLKLMLTKQSYTGLGSKYGSALLGSSGPSLQLGTETIKASDHVRLLGVTISSDLSLDKQVSTICSTCFYWLCQIQSIRWSLDTDSAAALVHALIASRVDYCNAVLAGAPRTITDRFQQVLNEAVVSGTRSSIAACPNYFTPSYIGWTFHNISSINSESQFTGVCRIRLLSTWWPTARVQWTSQAANALDRPTVDTSSAHLVFGRFSVVGLIGGTRFHTLSRTLLGVPTVQIGSENSSFCGAKGRVAH